MSMFTLPFLTIVFDAMCTHARWPLCSTARLGAYIHTSPNDRIPPCRMNPSDMNLGVYIYITLWM